MKRHVTILLAALMTGVLLPGGGCVNVHVDPIEANINVNVRLQNEIKSDLDNLYGGEVGAPPKPPTQPARGA